MSRPSTARRRLALLKRRRDYLKGLILASEEMTWDRSEFAALCWVIKVIEENFEVASAVSGEWRKELSA